MTRFGVHQRTTFLAPHESLQKIIVPHAGTRETLVAGPSGFGSRERSIINDWWYFDGQPFLFGTSNPGCILQPSIAPCSPVFHRPVFSPVSSSNVGFIAQNAGYHALRPPVRPVPF